METGKRIKVGVAVLLLSIVTLASCNEAAWDTGWGVWDGEVISRVPSPDKAVDAIIVEGSLGATTGFSSRVYLVAPGAVFNNKSEIFGPEKEILRADGIDGLTLGWKDSKMLELTFKSARIFHYSNFRDYTGPDQRSTRYNVRLTEISK